MPTPHNPAGLTASQIGGGWRLLDQDELKDRLETEHIQSWSLDAERWYSGQWIGAAQRLTYRTNLTREALAKLP